MNTSTRTRKRSIKHTSLKRNRAGGMTNITDTNLITSYIELKTADGTPFASALRELNHRVKKSLTHSRIREYERGGIDPAYDVYFVMLEDVLRHKLAGTGLDRSAIEEIIQLCKLPKYV